MMEIITAISSVGFPIVMCLLVFYQSNKTIRENTKAIRELTMMMRGKKYGE